MSSLLPTSIFSRVQPLTPLEVDGTSCVQSRLPHLVCPIITKARRAPGSSPAPYLSRTKQSCSCQHGAVQWNYWKGTVTVMTIPLRRTRGEGLGDSGRCSCEKRVRLKEQV